MEKRGVEECQKVCKREVLRDVVDVLLVCAVASWLFCKKSLLRVVTKNRVVMWWVDGVALSLQTRTRTKKVDVQE